MRIQGKSTAIGPGSQTTLVGWNRLQLVRFVDVIQLVALTALTILQLALWHRVPANHVLFAVYAGAIAALITIAWVARPHSGFWISLIDDLLLPAVILLIVFETIGDSIPAVNSTWLEPFLVSVDNRLFGMVGSVYLERFYTKPLLDLMHFFYALFYLFPISIAVVVYRRNSKAEFHEALCAIGLAFYLCYFLYYIFPVLGPYRNPTVYEQFTKDIFVSGGIVTRYVRAFVKHAELSSYDCFPSAHAAVTFMTVALAYRYKLPIRRYYLLPACMILISTVYLRYHYVLDIVASVFVAAGAYWIACVARKPDLVSYYHTQTEYDSALPERGGS